MAIQKNIFPFVIVVILSFVCMVSCYTRKHDESGYDFRPHPFTSLMDSTSTINVLSYGAKGDGSDDTEAFQNAWKDACSSPTPLTYFVVPENKNYLLRPIQFSGPCKSSVTMQVYGTIYAPVDRFAFDNDKPYWIAFRYIDNFNLEGGGTFDGNGNIWWQISCKINKTLPCKESPTALTFSGCNKLVLNNIKIQNAQNIHVNIGQCLNVKVSNLKIDSPEKSPNTDGIHVSNTQYIDISDTNIGAGDDCISIETGTQYLQATGITCGPGHGISIGSLGDGNSEAHVSNIVVNGATLSGTTNGVRIKTYQGGSGSASNIKFQNIVMNNVKNPIIIDQNYCDQAEPCHEQESAVQVENVIFQNITGSSSTGASINFGCSKTHPCQGITLANVKLKEENGGACTAICNNVNLKIIGNVFPRCS